MPKVIDHDQRRAEIVQATWRSIAERGIQATTMRELARELGLSNGAIGYYFPHKRAILTAAFEYVFEATNRRFAHTQRSSGATGIDALRAFLHEALPIDQERRLEARIVIPFLEFAAVDDDLAALFQDRMNEWLHQLTVFLQQAVDAGAARSGLDVPAAAALIVSTITGIQSMGVLMPHTLTPEKLLALADSLIAGLR